LLFKLDKTLHLVSTWTKETFWRLDVTILALLICFLCFGTLSNREAHIIQKNVLIYMQIFMLLILCRQ